MSLTQAIDALLAYVGDGQPIPTEGERWDRFEVLDRAVWVEAPAWVWKATCHKRKLAIANT